MKTEYTGSGGFLQRDGVEHKEYAEAYSAEIQKAEERDGALFMIEPPCTERYARWCERSAAQLMGSLLLDLFT